MEEKKDQAEDRVARAKRVELEVISSGQGSARHLPPATTFQVLTRDPPCEPHHDEPLNPDMQE